jgi:hypothetical protein
MRFPTLLTIAGILGIVFGIGFLVLPASSLLPYGVRTDASGLIMAQFFGAALLQLALVFLFIRDIPATHIPRLALGRHPHPAGRACQRTGLVHGCHLWRAGDCVWFVRGW